MQNNADLQTDAQNAIKLESGCRNIFAVGDTASFTVPRIGSIGHLKAEVLVNPLGKELGIIQGEIELVEFEFLWVAVKDAICELKNGGPTMKAT